MVTRRQSWLFYRPLPRNVPQVENQAAKTELLKLKYYSASCRLRDSQGSRNSDKLPARRGGGAFSIIPPCTMKYVVKATCRIKRHSKTKAGQILWLIILQSACRVDLPGSQILNLCNSCVSAIFIYSPPPPPSSSMSFIIFEMQDYRSTINMFGGGGGGVLFLFFFFGPTNSQRVGSYEGVTGWALSKVPWKRTTSYVAPHLARLLEIHLAVFFIYLFWFLGIITGM